MKVLVTGGAGFIGSAVCRLFVGELGMGVLNVDKLTYAANLASLQADRERPGLRVSPRRYRAIARRLPRSSNPLRPTRSCISRPNRMSTARSTARANSSGPISREPTCCSKRRSHTGASLPAERARRFRFHHVSTDEVFGSLGPDGKFSEDEPLPAQLALCRLQGGGDHLVRAWHETFGLPTVISNCSNNYGPYHFPEKLIPLAILKALEGEPVPVYGAGDNVRDWLYVEDHARALHAVLAGGRAGRELQHRRRWRADQSRGRECDLRPARRARAGFAPSAACASHQLCRRPARPRPALCDGCDKDPPRARLAAARELRDRAAQDRRVVSRQPLVVGADLGRTLRRRAARHRQPGRSGECEP